MWYPTDKTQIANALWADTLCKRKKGSLLYVKTNELQCQLQFKTSLPEIEGNHDSGSGKIQTPTKNLICQMRDVIQMSGMEIKDICETCLLNKYHKKHVNNKYFFFLLSRLHINKVFYLPVRNMKVHPYFLLDLMWVSTDSTTENSKRVDLISSFLHLFRT